VQVTLPSQFYLFASSSVNIFLTFASTNLFRYFDVVKRPVYLSLSHSPRAVGGGGEGGGGGRDVNLEGTDDVEVGDLIDLIVNAVDAAISSPGSAMLIQCCINGASMGTAYTNSSGVAVFSWAPSSKIVYNVVASYCGDGIYEASSASLTFDLRYPTNLGLWLESAPEFRSESSLDGYMYRWDYNYPPHDQYGPFTNGTWLEVGQDKFTTTSGGVPYTEYELYRSYVSFDTSALPDNAQVTSARLKLKCGTDHTSGSDFVVLVMGGSQPIYGSLLGGSHWGIGTALVGQWNTANFGAGYILIPVDVSQVNLFGRTQFELKTDREATKPDETNMVSFFSADSAGNEPYLNVTYRLGIADNSIADVDTLVEYQFRVENLPPNSGGESVNVCIDGSFHKTVQVSGSPPTAKFPWSANSTGVHYINASYGGNLYYKPDDLYFAVMAKASPVSLEFSVNSTSFAPGAHVALRARAINPVTYQPLSGLNIGFWEDGYGYGTLVNDRYYPTENGVATTDWVYRSVGGAHTIIAKVKDGQAVANVTLAIRPITLTVGVETKLWLWVERGLTDTEHTVYARLVRANDSSPPPSGQLIKLDVSGKACTLTTNSSGYANQSLNLVAVGGQTTTYQIRAMFEGAGFKTRNLTVKDPYGHDYPVCTTLQWDFKPSQNMVTLTVEAPKTDVTSSASDGEATVTQDDESTTATVPPPKTPEQMQAEAESKGLQTWGPDSFTIWPPFMKFHARVLIDWLGMDVHSWIGIGGCGIDAYEGLGTLLLKGFENVPLDMVDIVRSAFISSITATTALFIASLIAATFTSVTPSYALTLLLYTGGGLLAIGAANALPDARLSRAILYGIGATLLSLIIGAYAIDLLRDLPFVIIATLTGPPYIQLAAKAIVNRLVCNGLGVTSIALQLTFKNPLLIPFAVATLGLAALAIYLGWKRI